MRSWRPNKPPGDYQQKAAKAIKRSSLQCVSRKLDVVSAPTFVSAPWGNVVTPRHSDALSLTWSSAGGGTEPVNDLMLSSRFDGNRVHRQGRPAAKEDRTDRVRGLAELLVGDAKRLDCADWRLALVENEMWSQRRRPCRRH